MCKLVYYDIWIAVIEYHSHAYISGTIIDEGIDKYGHTF